MPNMQTLSIKKAMLFHSVLVFNLLQSLAKTFIRALDTDKKLLQ